MANDYFVKTGNPATGSSGSSSLIRSEFTALEAGFDKLPALTANGGKILAVNAGATALEAVTTTGTGSAVRATSPTLVTPLLGTPTSGDATNLTNTIAPQTHAATDKATPVDADEIPLSDSAATFGLKKLTWANIKATLLTWLQGTVFPSPGAIGSTTPAAGSFTTLSATGALTTAGLKEDASGNLGLGVTPSGWGNVFKALQIAGGRAALSSRNDANRLYATVNAYNNNTNWIYLSPSNATLYEQVDGTHVFYMAPPGTAGAAITFTQAMALDASGKLDVLGGVNKLTTASGVVDVSAATAPTSGQVLMATSGTAATWQTPASGVSLGGTNTWTGAQTFTNSLMKLLGSSTGVTTFTSANAGATNYTITFPAETFEVGYRNVPQNSQSAAYTLVLGDSGKHILHPSADTTARIFTIPANSSVAYPIGTAITFVNQNGAGVLTIAITTDTMRLAGAGTTGSRTLAANGTATALKITSTEWIISGGSSLT